MNKLAWVGLAALLGAAQPARALDPSKPPGGNFDLSHWKLTLPIGSAGSPTEISQPQLATFTNAYFYTAADGAMTFWCPVDGVTTGGSSYPRSELRELVDTNNDNNNWDSGVGTHTMDAQCKVTQVPGSGKTIIGQIHGFSGKAYPMIKLQFQSGSIVALYKKDPTSDTDTTLTFSNPGLNNLITYRIQTVTNNLNITVNGTTLVGDISLWPGQSCYFKAGDYCQDNTGSSPEGAGVSFYSLTVVHGSGGATAPSITTQPTNQTVTVGQNATFNVTASGTSPLSYQWYFNTNTLLTRATNASLTVTNAQTTNAGAYRVIVTNSVGSATSSVATLTVSVPTAPSITNQPQSQTVNAGQGVTFTIGASGTSPLNYQWYFNTNTPLSGATNSSFTINSALTNNAGAYSVIVTNSAGSATSSVATLTVNDVVVTHSSGVILDDIWLDGTRTDTSLPTEAAWFASSASTLTVATNAMTGITTSSTPTWWTYFTTNPAAPVQLGIGDTLKVTASFTPAGVNTNNNSQGLRWGLFDSSGNTRVLADGSTPNGTNVTGYMLIMNFGQTFGVSSPLQIRQRTDMTSSSLISSTSPYTTLNSGGPTNGAAGFSNGIPCTFVFSVFRNTNSVELTTSFSSTNGWSAQLSATNTTTTNLAASFDTFMMRSASAQTATNLVFTEFKVELITPQTPTVRLVNLGFNSNNCFTALLTGTPNTNYVIQVSTNLVNWTPLVTNSSPTGSISFTDTNSPAFNRRFYRALAQ